MGDTILWATISENAQQVSLEIDFGIRNNKPTF
jgi:hypothetical protein